MTCINWKRMCRHVKRIAAREGQYTHRYERFAEVVQMLDTAGAWSQGRRNGAWLCRSLCRQPPRMMVPVCVDLSALAVRPVLERHRAFIEKMRGIRPDLVPMLLVPDQEAADEALCATLGKTPEQLHSDMHHIMYSVDAVARRYGYEVAFMSDVIPDLSLREETARADIWANERYRRHIERQAVREQPVLAQFRSIGPDEPVRRALRLAGQYLALGRFAASRNWIVCNHSNPNMRWYRVSHTAVMHNPISIRV